MSLIPVRSIEKLSVALVPTSGADATGFEPDARLTAIRVL